MMLLRDFTGIVFGAYGFATLVGAPSMGIIVRVLYMIYLDNVMIWYALHWLDYFI
jgi:hypothetical protein